MGALAISAACAPKAQADTNTAAAGMRIELGPDGKPTSKPIQTTATSALKFSSTQPGKPLTSRKAAIGGGTIVPLNGQFRKATYATIGADGKARTTCMPVAISGTEAQK
jgi:hypothetical protein